MTQPINFIRIDLSSLVHNLSQVRAMIGPNVEIMGIVKSDAYGHGLLPVANTLVESGVDRLGVAYLEEALELRENGIKVPIIILCGIRTREEAEAVIEHKLTPVLYDMISAEILNEEINRKNVNRVNVQLKVDTGMGRLGIDHRELGNVLNKINNYSGLYLEGLMSHFSSADDLKSRFTEKQVELFVSAIENGRSMGYELPLNNLANSAGIMARKKSYLDMVRPGIMLYGGLPSPGFSTSLHLRPVMSLRGRIIQIRDHPDNTPVSYGRTYHTDGPRRIAVLSAGYGNGIPRNISNRGKVLIRGRKADIAGRVCMNLTMADITGMEDIKTGDEVVFLGPQNRELITGDDMAEWGDTISYEIYCSLGGKNSREYIQ